MIILTSVKALRLNLPLKLTCNPISTLGVILQFNLNRLHKSVCEKPASSLQSTRSILTSTSANSLIHQPKNHDSRWQIQTMIVKNVLKQVQTQRKYLGQLNRIIEKVKWYQMTGKKLKSQKKQLDQEEYTSQCNSAPALHKMCK